MAAFKIDRCPMCGEETNVSVDLSADAPAFKCGEGCEFTAQDMHKMINQWVPLLAWAEAAWPKPPTAAGKE